MLGSYGIARLLAEYDPGSRKELYKKVNKWLDTCAAEANKQGAVPFGQDQQTSRAFLLLAEPGMGKSVFSAAMHTKLTARTNKEHNLILVGHVTILCAAKCHVAACHLY